MRTSKIEIRKFLKRLEKQGYIGYFQIYPNPSRRFFIELYEPVHDVAVTKIYDIEEGVQDKVLKDIYQHLQSEFKRYDSTLTSLHGLISPLREKVFKDAIKLLDDLKDKHLVAQYYLDEKVQVRFEGSQVYTNFEYSDNLDIEILGELLKIFDIDETVIEYKLTRLKQSKETVHAILADRTRL